MSLENEAILKLAEAVSRLSTATASDRPTSSQQAESSVQAVSIKLPEFWSEDPEVWFVRVEAQLRSRSVTADQTKFDYVVGTLDNRTAAEIKGVLTNPPQSNKYQTIKDALLQAFGKTQAQKDAQLLSMSGLGDKKPSAFLRQLQSLNSNAETLRRAFFLAQLPAQVRAIVAIQEFANLEELAVAADRIMEANYLSPHSNMAAVNTNQRVSSKQTSPKVTGEHHICYYHQHFGVEARKCNPGCIFAKLLSSKKNSSTKHQGNAAAGRQ